MCRMDFYACAELHNWITSCPLVSMMSTDHAQCRNAMYARPNDARRLANDMSSTILRIKGEYDEMPGLVLTEAQARRLWGLDLWTCRLVLTALLEERFLKRTPTGMYVRAS